MKPRTLGVIGTLVWDRIVGRFGESAPVEEWGGIAYALAALSASLPGGWSILPIVKVGADMAEDGCGFLTEIPRVDPSAILVVPEPNNRVELRYETSSRRRERLMGGVPPWTWEELSPLVGRCGAIYINFISGFEMDLETARALGAGFGGPTYADLHSLFLGRDEHGYRVPRTLEGWATWLNCFDAVQMNEDEFDLLGGSDDPWRRAAGALGPDLELITVTLGERGAAYAVAAGFRSDPMQWSGRRSSGASVPSRAGRVAVTTDPRVGDPTGCGDVWGASTFARLLAGDALEAAMAEGNRLGGLNVDHRGARGLFGHFADVPARHGPGREEVRGSA